MEANGELCPISEEPNQSFNGSSCVSIVPSPITTKANPSFDESTRGFELSPTSTELNQSFDDSSCLSIDPSPSASERIPSPAAVNLPSAELKAVSGTRLTSIEASPNSVARNFANIEHSGSFKSCVSVNSAAIRTRNSNQEPNHSPKPRSLAIVPPPSLSRLLTVLPPPRKSKMPVNLTSCKNRSGCDSTNFSLTMAQKVCTLRSILKCGPRDDSHLIGLHRKVEPDVPTETPNSKININ